jgi:hypothetical protein
MYSVREGREQGEICSKQETVYNLSGQERLVCRLQKPIISLFFSCYLQRLNVIRLYKLNPFDLFLYRNYEALLGKVWR